MGKKKTKNKRNRELKVIFFIILVAAALFIISTYAWFTTQKNVSITNLSGTVEVAEGLEISLDAKTWANEIVLGEDMNIIDNAYEGHKNISPKEMLPVSTLGKLKNTTSQKDLKMIRGKVTNSKELSEIIYMNEALASGTDSSTHDSSKADYPGYFAFDIFLKNSSKQYDKDDELQLNYDSSLKIIENGNEEVGLQNTVRVALAKYGTGAIVSGEGSNAVRSGVADVIASQDEILKKTGAVSGGDDVYLTDVAIWEPNSDDHVEYIVTNNNVITWSASEQQKYGQQFNETKNRYLFTANSKMPTYVLTEKTVDTSNTVIKDIYWWDTEKQYKVDGDQTQHSNSGLLEKQMTLQTTKTSETDYRIKEGVQNLFSTTSTESDKKAFSIAPNSIIRLRVYVWLEGQDIDCINYASHGGGVTLDLGLVKGSEIGSHGEAE